MDVNHVKFGNYSIGNSRPNAKRNNLKEAQENPKSESKAQDNKNINPEQVFSAMNIVGAQNAAQINLNPISDIPDVSKYLTDDRIADIEAMMKEFDNGVNVAANAISQEFPGLFSAAQTNALAARVFAQE